jgi:FAD/FMN-containing dehydrogenase
VVKRKTRRVKGWGRVSSSDSNVFFPREKSEILEILSLGKTLARGGGMSFGDAALNDSHNLIETTAIACHEDMMLDVTNGILQCSSSPTQGEILKLTAPKGWILPAIPGSQGITIGGSIVADGHGKNHFARGSISKHLISMKIMIASGEVVEVNRKILSDLFWSTIGGLGLTGVILSVKLKLQPITSLYAKHKIMGFEGVDELIDLIENHKLKYEYILGWIDGGFKPRKSWSGALLVGKSLAESDVEDPWILPIRHKIKIPFPNPIPGGGMLAGRLVNKAIGRKFRSNQSETVDINRFFFPQDAVSNWNLAFGYSGFIDYQCCVPIDKGKEFFEEVHQFLNKHRVFCFLVAVKRFGSPERIGSFSFIQNGFSLALDIPVRSGILDLLRSLDEIVLSHSGRINPIKDARVSPVMLRRMYPRLDEWISIKEKYDPTGIFESDLSRRLRLTTS